jgi:hypothetical protein
VLFPELTGANDLAVIAAAVFMVVVVPAMLRATGLAIFAFVYPCADWHWQQYPEVCPPAIRMPPAKSGIKDHAAPPGALNMIQVIACAAGNSLFGLKIKSCGL